MEKTGLYWLVIFHQKMESQVTKALSENQAILVELGKEDQTPRDIATQLVVQKERLWRNRNACVRRSTASYRRGLLQALHDAKDNRLVRIRTVGVTVFGKDFLS